MLNEATSKIKVDLKIFSRSMGGLHGSVLATWDMIIAI